MIHTSLSQSELAVHGGTPVRIQPWPLRRLFGDEEKNAVNALFDRAIEEGSHILGYNGEEESSYCREFAEMLGGGYADGVNSGSNAVYVALRSLDIKPGSEVIVPPITDPGGVMPVVVAGAIPVVADSVPGSYNTGAEQIEHCITEKTTAILVAHIAGIPVEMGPVMELARKHEIPVIEDCAQAHGALWHGRPVGTIGEVAAFSTMFGKHHATGGQGGVVFTRSEERYWRIRQVADRGKPFGITPGGGNIMASLNCNMDELHAAIGRVQLRRLPEFLSRRRLMASLLKEKLEKELATIRLVTGSENTDSAYWFFLLKFDPGRLSVDKTLFARAVEAEGVPLSYGYWHVPVEHPWFRNLDCYRHQQPLVNVAATESTHLMMSLHEGWSEREVEDLVTALRKVETAYLKT